MSPTADLFPDEIFPSVPREELVKTPLEHTDECLVGVHEESKCAGETCTIHNRTDHSMRSFPQHWRQDRGIMERICPHGVGHPDPDDYRLRNGDDGGIHGCDGCCGDPSNDKEDHNVYDPPPQLERIFDVVAENHPSLYLNNARFAYGINLASQAATPEDVIEILIEALAGACQAFEDILARVQSGLTP